MAEPSSPKVTSAPSSASAAAAAAAPAPATEPKFEVLLAELEKLVGDLEGGKLSLEESLASFERGMQLSGQAAAILDAADLRIELLTGTTESPKTAPFGGA